MLPSDAQMHGEFAAKEVVVEQKVAFHACVDSLQDVSPVKNPLPSPGVARKAWTEHAPGMFSVVEPDADYSLLRAKTKFDAMPASTRIR